MYVKRRSREFMHIMCVCMCVCVCEGRRDGRRYCKKQNVCVRRWWVWVDVRAPTTGVRVRVRAHVRACAHVRVCACVGASSQNLNMHLTIPQDLVMADDGLQKSY